jgi:hypothetical protein
MFSSSSLEVSARQSFVLAADVLGISHSETKKSVTASLASFTELDALIQKTERLLARSSSAMHRVATDAFSASLSLGPLKHAADTLSQPAPAPSGGDAPSQCSDDLDPSLLQPPAPFIPIEQLGRP